MVFWQILAMALCLIQLYIFFTKSDKNNLAHNLCLFILGGYALYCLNLNWGRFGILISQILMIFLLFNGSSNKSIFIGIFGFLFAFYDFILGYAIISLVVFYWLLLNNKNLEKRLEVRYFLIGFVFELIFLSFSEANLLWLLFFGLSRFYLFSALNLIAVSQVTKQEVYE